MTKIEKTLKELSDLYRFYHKIQKIKSPKPLVGESDKSNLKSEGK